MDFLRFLISKIFLKHLLLAVAISLIILLGVLVWLKFYTHHGQKISVPNLTGLTIEEVKDVVKSRKLNFHVIDSIYADEMPRGTVVKQNPKPNSKVKVRRRIFITMNAVNPEKVTMPNLVSLSLRQAMLALENSGFELGEISYRPDYAVNSVLQQNFNGSVIKEGTRIEKGTKIDLVLGMGLSNETTTIPRLGGLNLEEAKSEISRKYLNFGVATYDESVRTGDDSLRAWVYKQYPDYAFNAKVNKGTEVFIWLTADSTLLPASDALLLNNYGGE
ncbi:MAG: PASTA domain-containing protein [Bacteroidales bacterium]|nr:PASTA domain-containing protein [Bacteroidales bacterium]